MSTSRPRVILDCNTLVQAVISPHGPGAACLALADAGRITLLMSRATLGEAREVLQRPEITQLKPDLTPSKIERLLEALLYRAELLPDVPMGAVYSRDPDDQPYLDLAVTGSADYLVTRDKDLIVLATAHSAEAKEFRQRHQNRLQILAPEQFLNEVRSPGP